MSIATTSQSMAPPAAPVANKNSKGKHEPAELPAVLEKLVEDGKTSSAKSVLGEQLNGATSKAPAVKAPAGLMVSGIRASVMQPIALSLITPSKTNPRKHFDGPAFDDLVASVKAHGVIVPVLVRPTGWSNLAHTEFTYELVAGERRFRASKAAGLVDIPAIVRELSDREALELQIVENLQREDVTALEEAEGYVALLAGIEGPRQEAIEQIAAKVGKSSRYVYARMKLTELAPEVKAAVSSGKLPVSHADLVATYPATKQAEVMALAFTRGEDENGEYVADGLLRSFRNFKGYLDRVAEREKQEAERKAAQRAEKKQAKQADKSPAAEPVAASSKPSRDNSAALKAKFEAEARKRELQRKREEAANVAVFQAIVGKVKDISGAVLDTLIEQEFQLGDSGGECYVAQLFGWPAPAEGSAYGWLQKQYAAHAKLTAEQKARLYFALRNCVEVEYGNKQLDERALRLKLDPKKIRAAAVEQLKKAEAKEAQAEPAAPAKAAKGKAAGKRGRK